MVPVITLYIGVPQAVIVLLWWMSSASGYTGAGSVLIAAFASALIILALYSLAMLIGSVPVGAEDDPDRAFAIFFSGLLSISASAAAATSIMAFRRLRQHQTEA